MYVKHIRIDEESMRDLFDAQLDSLVAFLSYYSRDTQLVEDIVQEVFIELWEERDRLEIKHIKTYLHRAARNKMLNHIRDSSNRTELLANWSKAEMETTRASDCFDMNEFTKIYRAALEELPPRCKAIFTQSREQKMSYKQIAEENNISIKTVESQMSIALKRMRKIILASYSPNLKAIFLILLMLEG